VSLILYINFIHFVFLLSSHLFTIYDIQPVTSFDHLIPSNPFDLYWTMWNTDQTTFRGHHLLVLESLFIHHLLVLESLFIHHPQAILSSCFHQPLMIHNRRVTWESWSRQTFLGLDQIKRYLVLKGFRPRSFFYLADTLSKMLGSKFSRKPWFLGQWSRFAKVFFVLIA
jgi:hypothetical protein